MAGLQERIPLASPASIVLRWVPGHTGLPDNEHADREAKRAITEGSSAQDLLPKCLHNPLPSNKPALHAHHRSQLSALALLLWRASPRFHRVNRYLPVYSLTRFRRILFSLPRKLSTVAVYFITGHNTLRHHLYHISKAPNSLCPSCRQRPETTDHYLYHCPAHNAARRTLAQRCSLPVRRLTLRAIPSHPKRLAALFRYTNDTAQFRHTLGDLPEWDPPGDDDN